MSNLENSNLNELLEQESKIEEQVQKALSSLEISNQKVNQYQLEIQYINYRIKIIEEDKLATVQNEQTVITKHDEQFREKTKYKMELLLIEEQWKMVYENPNVKECSNKQNSIAELKSKISDLSCRKSMLKMESQNLELENMKREKQLCTYFRTQ